MFARHLRRASSVRGPVGGLSGQIARLIVRSRWQFAHTMSHFFASSRTARVAALPAIQVTLPFFVQGSRWSKSIMYGGNDSPQVGARDVTHSTQGLDHGAPS